MNMNLLSKAAEFEKLCSIAFKKKAYDPSIPNAQKHYEKYPFPQIAHFGQSLKSWVNLDDGTSLDMPGMSVDKEAVKTAGGELYWASKQYQYDSKNIGMILKALENVMSLTRDGGGKLYNKALGFYNEVKQIANPVKPVAQKKKTPPSWLNQYMAGEQADADKSGMQASLDKGNSSQDALKRNPYLPDFKVD